MWAHAAATFCEPIDARCCFLYLCSSENSLPDAKERSCLFGGDRASSWNYFAVGVSSNFSAYAILPQSANLLIGGALEVSVINFCS